MSSNTNPPNEPPIVQDEIRQAKSNPQGVLDGNFGFIITDQSGNVYVKQSPQGTLTGWKIFTVTTA